MCLVLLSGELVDYVIMEIQMDVNLLHAYWPSEQLFFYAAFKAKFQSKEN